MELGEVMAIFGPGVAGAVFGAGWWFWVDAVVCSSVKISFIHYLPGIFASLAALMFNGVRREDIDYSPYEEDEWRVKLWLFISYVVAFVSLAASVGLLIQDTLVNTGPSAWTGVAGILQYWPNILDLSFRVVWLAPTPYLWPPRFRGVVFGNSAGSLRARGRRHEYSYSLLACRPS